MWGNASVKIPSKERILSKYISEYIKAIQMFIIEIYKLETFYSDLRSIFPLIDLVKVYLKHLQV